MRRIILVALLLLPACAGRSDFQAFPVAPHRPAEIRERGLRVDRAIEEFVATRGLDVVQGARLQGVTVTGWSPAAGIENGDPPIAECDAARGDGTEPDYRVRYRFTVDTRGGQQSLLVEGHWQVLRGLMLDNAPRWVECRSTGVYERNVQEQLLVRARMLSG